LVNLANARAIGNRVRSPSSLSQDNVTLGIFGATRFDHPRDRLTDHYIADLKGLRIGLSVVHAATHIGIKRKIQHAEQNLS
jgi:hypothetical protein